MSFIIDAHIHIFPDRFCPQTVQFMAAENPDVGLVPLTDGSALQAAESLKANNIDYGVMMPIVTNPKSQHNVNDYAAEVQNQYPSIFAFGSVHPLAPDWESELNRIVELGLHGIKIHPDYQGIFLDDTCMFPVFESISSIGLPVMVHTGFDPHSPNVVHASPAMVKKIATAFPKMTLVAAHMGAFAYDENMPIDYYDDCKNLWFDNAIAPRTMTPEKLKILVDHYGAERIMFGTDSPWSEGKIDLAFLNQTGLSFNDREQILWKTASNVYGLL